MSDQLTLTHALTPKAVAEHFRSLGLTEGEVLDIIKRVADKTGWTKSLRLVGLYTLKPDAPDDETEAAAA